MKRIVAVFTFTVIMACITSAFAVSLPNTPVNIAKAENTPSAAKFFNPCSTEAPNGPDANVRGDIVVVVTADGRHFQYGSDFTPLEAWKLYCVGSGGEGGE